MRRSWKVILGIVAVAVILGGLCIGVGLLTGADDARIIQNLDDHFRLNAYVAAYTDYAKQLWAYFTGLL